MNTCYDVCIDLSDGTGEPVLIDADNPSHALSQALLDPNVLSAVVVPRCGCAYGQEVATHA